MSEADNEISIYSTREELMAEITKLRALLAKAMPLARVAAKTQFAEFFSERIPGLIEVKHEDCAGGRKARITLMHESGMSFFREIRKAPESWDSECADLALSATEWFAKHGGRHVDMGELKRDASAAAFEDNVNGK